MPLFRRRQAQAEQFRAGVGVDGHEVVVGGGTTGCTMLDELDGYVGMIARRMPASADGRDSIAVQNAKMDYVELSDAAMLVVTLACEELVSQGFLTEQDVPRRPQLPAIARDLPTYDYIQQTYRRAERRVAWMRTVDALFRERGIGIVKESAAA